MLRDRPATDRELLAESVYARLHPLMASLGVMFLVVVLGRFARGVAADVIAAVVVVLWAVFVAEYVLRLVIAPDTGRFLRSTWWQVMLLFVPVLSAFRALLAVRAARSARVLAASLRATRSAGSVLSQRLAWLGLTTVIVVFTAADILYGVGDVRPYGAALHDAAMAGISGESIASGDSGWPAVVDVALAAYSAVVFAALAGALGGRTSWSTAVSIVSGLPTGSPGNPRARPTPLTRRCRDGRADRGVPRPRDRRRRCDRAP